MGTMHAMCSIASAIDVLGAFLTCADDELLKPTMLRHPVKFAGCGHFD